MYVGRREFDIWKSEIERKLNGNDQRLDKLTDEVSGLRGDFKTYAKIGGLLVTVLVIAAPFMAAHIH